MDKIQLWVDHLLETFGLEGDCVAYISHASGVDCYFACRCGRSVVS